MSVRVQIHQETAYIAIPDLVTALSEYAEGVEDKHPMGSAYLRLINGQLLELDLMAHQNEAAS